MTFKVSSPILMKHIGRAIFILSFSVGTFALPGVTEAPTKSVIAQMFEWSWDSIAQECTDFLGPAGYGYVQTSPPMEHIQGKLNLFLSLPRLLMLRQEVNGGQHIRFDASQPVSYAIVSNRGNREQFAAMIKACNAAGVIADAVTNHMSGAESGVGTANSKFTHYDYPGTYQVQDFHHCGLAPNDNIQDYSNRDQVQKCQLEGLADLATDTDYVQGRIAEYLRDLLSLGVTGLRMDAAKHIASSDLSNILGRVGPVPYITQEVIYGNNEPVQPSEYVQNGNVQEFRYTDTLKWAFTEGGIDSLQDFGNRGWLAGSTANVFVANHDTERGSSLSYKYPSNLYTLASVFSLAHPYGANPTILSSYMFDGRDDGAPNNWQGTCTGNTGANGWLCQHRWSPIAGMVGFRNTVGSAVLQNWQTGINQQIAFSRGSSGFVAINNGDEDWSKTFTTGLPDATYCDVYAGPMTSSGCAGTSYKVTNGSVNITIPGRTAVALHTGAVVNTNQKTLLGRGVFFRNVGQSHNLRSQKDHTRRRLSADH
ncbi:glycoside hydrolase [Serendipita vermifera]|nr:glycoside hydrolase [Serendipita vermifera]